MRLKHILNEGRMTSPGRVSPEFFSEDGLLGIKIDIGVSSEGYGDDVGILPENMTITDIYIARSGGAERYRGELRYIRRLKKIIDAVRSVKVGRVKNYGLTMDHYTVPGGIDYDRFIKNIPYAQSQSIKNDIRNYMNDGLYKDWSEGHEYSDYDDNHHH